MQCCSMPLLNCNTHRNSHAEPLNAQAHHLRTRPLLSMPLRLNALLCRSYICPCQCSATPLVCYSMPKHYIPLLCRSTAHLRSALAPRFFSLPALERAIQCPCFEAHCQGLSSLFNALAPLIPASPFLINAFHCPCPAYQGFAVAPQINSAT